MSVRVDRVNYRFLRQIAKEERCVLPKAVAVRFLRRVCQATLQENFNFSSTYSESSTMRSAICSACMPKSLSTNSVTNSRTR